MGNSCSSGQAHKDNDSISQQSDDGRSGGRAKRASSDAGAPRAASAEPAQQKAPRPVITSVSDSTSPSSPAPMTPRDAANAAPAEKKPAAAGCAADLPETLKALLVGKTSPALARRKPKAFIIYVCAADSQDCCAEKGVLHCGAGARLRTTARARGWRVHAADLHWRSPLERHLDTRFPALCLAEIKRQSELGALVPVLFLNWELGTPLLPQTLEGADFEAALEAIADEQDKALLRKWYRVDGAAATSCYRVRGGAGRGRRELSRALNALVRALPNDARDAYLTTVVEQEVQNAVLMSGEAARRCVWVCRSPAPPAPPLVDPADAHHAELQRRVNNLHAELKQQVSEKNIIRASVRGGESPRSDEQYSNAVGSALAERLAAMLDALVAERDEPTGLAGVPQTLFEEVGEHLHFCERSAQHTTSRELPLNELKAYVCGESSVPLALIGGAGCGKATLVARAASQAHTWRDDLTLIIRFVGLTPHSSSSHQLLKSIVDQCHVLHYGTVYTGRNDVASLSSILKKLLACLGKRGPTLLCVVGADALRGCRWLPSKLPDNVKMIVTVTEETDEPSSSAIMAVLSSEEGPKAVRAGRGGASEARALLAAATAAPPASALAAVDKCTAPLYAKILAWQLSVLSESEAESDVETPDITICEDLDTQLLQVFAQTEAALGAEQVRVCLALLTAARRGLDDTEMLDLLAHDELFRSEETYLPWAPACLVWSRAAALLAPWLRWDARGAARWRDAALAVAAKDHYLADGGLKARNAIVEYFEGVWFDENDPKMVGRLVSQENKFSDECYNTRKLDELPYQHFFIYKDDPEKFANQQYFTKLDWIHDKLAATDTCHFLEDLALVHIDPLPEHLSLLKDFFETHSYSLDYDHRQFYGLFKMTIDRKRSEGVEFKSDIVKDWIKSCWEPPVPTLYPINEEFWKMLEPKDKKECNDKSKGYDHIVRFATRGKFVATVSTQKEELCVWDVTKCKLVRRLLGVPAPAHLVLVDETRAVALCGRELKLFDLDQGKFVTGLKGVMNQKMPYFGLHDDSHLVALARNRMYVNLMNILTGDCVTTFKAGEDRFLNSLLVSGDGRVLVCGDETQKPFPLLVWSLTSRKLLYDLRIPHHDFDTTKAAITYEGSYVCVVCRELDEPSPNFIVVYDLHSGTLFKRWKPGRDTVALAISSHDACVVAALEDAAILVWDLITGNCRLTLRGHTAAPSVLRLAGSGGVLLSTDGAARDMSVRLWDLHAGKLIAVYTPPEKITCCEVLLGGSVIALALENCEEIVCLQLHGPTTEAVRSGRDAEYDDQAYGDEANEGKTYHIKNIDSC